MTDEELVALLDGADGVTLRLSSGHRVHFSRHELRYPVAWRAAIRRQMGHTGWIPPVYDHEDHDLLMRMIFGLLEAEEHAAQAA